MKGVNVLNNFKGILRAILLPTLMVILVGCVGIQNVKVYERIEGEMVMTKQVKARIWGTSGQQITDKDISIEKSDATDKAVEVFKVGLSAGVKVASNAKEVI
jgi:hypothetical protein